MRNILMLDYIPEDRNPKGLVQISILSGEAEEMSSSISSTHSLSAPLLTIFLFQFIYSSRAVRNERNTEK